MKSLHVALCLVAFRLCNFYLVRTWFVPDEIFQSVEVAHRMVFGTGHLSWEWSNSLRSVFHPYLIALVFQALRVLHIDSNELVVIAPRLLHALIYAVSDYHFYLLARRMLKSFGTLTAMFSYFSCWFVWYCAPRTLSNSLETALTLIALNWYPLSRLSPNATYWPYMVIALTSILIRPTAVLLWAPLGLYHLIRCHSPLRLLVRVCIPSMLPVLLTAFLLDSFWYGSWTFSAWNFAKFNVFEGGSGHFGVHPWHWFLFQGLPAVLTVQLVPIFLGAVLIRRRHDVNWSLLFVSVFYVLFHSFLAHKEHRFLLPVIPLLCIYAGYFFSLPLSGVLFRIRRLLVFVMLTVNIPLAFYTGFFHQVGPFHATYFMISNATARSVHDLNVVQLMPCYSMPQYSYFHLFNASIYALDCSPNLLKVSDYVDEADAFHDAPIAWIDHHVGLVSRAHYIVMYERIFDLVKERLQVESFVACARFFHAHFLSSSRQDHYIVVACKV